MAALRAKTAPLLLAERAREAPGTIAYRAKRRGIYVERSWADFRDLTARFAAGLRALGLVPGMRVAIMGDAGEEWAIADLGAQAAGAITFGIYPTASISEVAFQLRDGGATIFIAENQEYVDKVLPLLDQLEGVRWVVVVDTTAMFAYDHPRLVAFDEVIRRGADDRAAGADAFAEAAGALDPRAPAFIVYTSGTTGNPKGALVAHGRHLAGAYTLIDRFPMLSGANRTVIYLPLCHVLGRDVAITLPLMSGLVPHYGESLEDLPQTLFEVAPEVLFTVPRYLQKFLSQVLVGIENTSPLKRAVYDLALGYGRRFARRRWDGAATPPAQALYAALHAAAFRPVLNKLGLDKLRLVLCGGAPLARETMALWQILGVNVAEIYGQTETAGAIITGQSPYFPRPGDVGAAPAGWQIRLGEADEILVKGEDLFEGYWNQPEATREVLGGDGWLRTGDVGTWADGRLRIIDRARDFIVTAGGKSLSPTFIENALRASPFIGEATVFGDRRKYLTALVEIDYDTVSDWARNNNVHYTGFTDLAERAEIGALIGREIEKANAELARVEQIKAFRILPKMLDPEEEGEPVTPTRKVKRNLMYERFRALVDSMYSDEEERLVAARAGDVLEEATR